jgi:hypothetical protein
MEKFYKAFYIGIFFLALLPLTSLSQDCTGFNATYQAYESLCTATGSIKINTSGGSGLFKYKVTGTINTNFTSTDSITGLSPGIYSLIVNDITTNCTITLSNIEVPGSYKDPRFTMNAFDVTCDNGSNGRIALNSQSAGRAPFTYAIVAPSPMGIGTANSTGTFNNLAAGVYTIRLMDSCGGIQTRLVTINNYRWKIDSVSFKKVSCDSAKGYIRASDNKGNISTTNGIPGLTYGVVRMAGDTIWSTNPNFSFYLSGQNNFDIVVKDACGKIKKAPVAVNFKPSVGNQVTTYGLTCNSFSAALQNVSNFFDPEFCLTDSTGLEISCNSVGKFTNIPYGSYCIKAHDSCSDTIITRCFKVMPPPVGIGSTVMISNKSCTSFSAAITGQHGLTSSSYCLFDSANNLLDCNNTGVFDNLAFGSYCINVKDSCRDTTFTRCFSAAKAVPVIPAVIGPGYTNCDNFGVIISGDSLMNPRFCIFDSTGTNIVCNNTGVFDSLAYGSYCIAVYDSCYDTTITRCLAVYGPSIANNLGTTIINKTCNSFTANVSGSNLSIEDYCLYKSDSTLIECNTTGTFDNLIYGAYFVKAHNSCPDTTFTYAFGATPPGPWLDAEVIISNKTCGIFSVNTTGENNFTNAEYCLYKDDSLLMTCNTDGVFTNLVYGSYCIKIKDGCYDTTVTRCFSVAANSVEVIATSSKSCNYGFAKLSVSVAGGVLPITVRVINPDGNTFFVGTFYTSNINIDSVPGSLVGERYEIIAIDNCGNIDSTNISALPSVIIHKPSVLPKCPSSTWLNGSGTIKIKASSNTGTMFIRIIKKNTTFLSPTKIPDNVSGDEFSFNNLGPGTYVIRYKANDACNKYFYDTVSIQPYQYPALDRSSAYQCDQNGFSLGAVVSNGVGPYTYEIIGSSPPSPSIVTTPQADPIFTINNGTTYSLVRLRVLDACGNASLGDASILPLANNGIIADYNCFQLYSTLKVDTLYNSAYAWYYKHSVDGLDSTFLSDGYSIYLPNVTPSDTGIYVCHLVVNNGCIKRTYYYHLDGSCSHYLPVVLERFAGNYVGNTVALNWEIEANYEIAAFLVERMNNNNRFLEIGRLHPNKILQGKRKYDFLDLMPNAEKNVYRLKMIFPNKTTSYSKELTLTKKQALGGISIFPNPVKDLITIEFKQQGNRNYHVKLLNLMNQVVMQTNYNGSVTNKLQITRTSELRGGVYIIKVLDISSNKEYSQKLLLE